MSDPQQVTKPQAIEILRGALQELSGLHEQQHESYEFQKWERDTEIAIKHIFGEKNDNAERFASLRYVPVSLFVDDTDESPSEKRAAYLRGLDKAKVLLDAMITEVERFW